MIKTKKRAWLLAAGNHGLSIEEYDSIASLKSCWWQGLTEGMVFDLHTGERLGEREACAENIMVTEYDEWVQVLINAHPEDVPLPDYWADVDEWFDEHSD